MFIARYTPVFIQLYQFRWNNIDYSHAYIVLPVSLGLAWYKRKEVMAALGGVSSAGDSARGLVLFLREYTHAQGRKVYLYLLDAGNFHNPRICLTGAGFKTRDLDDVAFTFKPSARVKDIPFGGNSIYINKGDDGALVTYWMIINGKKVSWTQQKFIELWYSLIGKRKAGLMVRMDIPTNEADLPYAREVVKSFAAALDEAVSVNDRWYIFGR